MYVNTSGIGGGTGEGLFARTAIPAATVFVVYAGRIHRDAEDELVFPNMTTDEAWAVHTNWIAYTWPEEEEEEEEGTMDIPPCMSDIVDYRASLGHKVENFGESWQMYSILVHAVLLYLFDP